MNNRSVHMIFESSGMPVPTEEEVLFEACEIVQRSGWGLPLIEKLHKLSDPYWREAIARCLWERWREKMRDKDEDTYYYDMDGNACYCWMDADYDFNRVIRKSTAEQVEHEQQLMMPPEPEEMRPVYVTTPPAPVVNHVTHYTNIEIKENHGPIISDSDVTIHPK